MPQRYFIFEDTDKITGQDAHHIKKVLRMNVGDEIIVCFNSSCFLSEIKAIGDDVTYEKKQELIIPKQLDITLFQGMPKGNKIETTLKYATMFGVTHIVLTDMVRTIIKQVPNQNKMARYQMIIKESSELSHRSRMPRLSHIKSLDDVDWSVFDLILLADEEEKNTLLKQVIDRDVHDLKIALIIGPEGGIADRERKLLKRHEAIAISLGKNILTSEIACLYALSVLSALND